MSFYDFQVWTNVWNVFLSSSTHSKNTSTRKILGILLIKVHKSWRKTNPNWWLIKSIGSRSLTLESIFLSPEWIHDLTWFVGQYFSFHFKDGFKKTYCSFLWQFPILSCTLTCDLFFFCNFASNISQISTNIIVFIIDVDIKMNRFLVFIN